MKALWLSRHPMTNAQLISLFSKVREAFNSEFSPEPPTNLQLVHMVSTLSSDSDEAVWQICQMAELNGCDIVTGVFPANVAVALAQLGWKMQRPFLAYVPVAKPAAATHGETREFVHSHWERI